MNRGQWAGLAKQFGLRSFQALLELYDLLSSLHRQQITVATRWLDPQAARTRFASALIVLPSEYRWANRSN